MDDVSGFTLIELMIVVAIIGILALVATVGYRSVMGHVRYSSIATQLDQMAKAAALDKIEVGSWMPDVLLPFGGDPSFDAGSLPPNMQEVFRHKWPKPPCENWAYDWDNFLGSPGHDYVRISVVDINTRHNIFSKCLDGGNTPCIGTAHFNGSIPVEITDWKAHSVSCHEYWDGSNVVAP